MLVTQFSLGVELDHKDKLLKILDDFGIAATKDGLYTEKLCFSESKTRVYFDCYIPYNRLKPLLDYLDSEFEETVIFTY